MASSSPDLLIDGTETSGAEFLTISPILLDPLIPIFPFLHISCMSNAILNEFRLEFVPFNQIGLNRVHFSNLRLFRYRARSGLAKEVGMGAERPPLLTGQRGVFCQSSEE